MELLQQYPALMPFAAGWALVTLLVGVFFFLRFANRKLWNRFVAKVGRALSEMGSAPPPKGIAIVELVWLIATIGIVVLGALGGIFGWFASGTFTTIFWLMLGLSIVLGFYTGRLPMPFGKKK